MTKSTWSETYEDAMNQFNMCFEKYEDYNKTLRDSWLKELKDKSI